MDVSGSECWGFLWGERLGFALIHGAHYVLTPSQVGGKESKAIYCFHPHPPLQPYPSCDSLETLQRRKGILVKIHQHQLVSTWQTHLLFLAVLLLASTVTTGLSCQGPFAKKQTRSEAETLLDEEGLGKLPTMGGQDIWMERLHRQQNTLS